MEINHIEPVYYCLDKGTGVALVRAEDKPPRGTLVDFMRGSGVVRPGAVVQLNTSEGLHPVTVVKVGRHSVDVDTNHPLAGQSLTFDIEVTDVRAATEEELAHGHAHGPGGHHHH